MYPSSWVIIFISLKLYLQINQIKLPFLNLVNTRGSFIVITFYLMPLYCLKIVYKVFSLSLYSFDPHTWLS